jgi:assimilatory nitrate reductase catalytic subunit
MTALASTCPYCGVGCGVLAEAADISGDASHPANFGRLCVKGAALGETLSLPDRLLRPRLHGEDVPWDRALDRLASAFAGAIAEHGPDSVAFYVSGQLLTEDYYVANKLMKGFIGSANIDTNSRLCMSSSVAGHVRAFGADTVPGCYEDLELAELVVLVGSNAAWCHPVLFQRIQAARKTRPQMKLVVIDPRRTATAEAADLHLALAPGSDVALFNGLLRHLAESGAADHGFIARHTDGLAAALQAAEATDLSACGLAAEDVEQFFDWFRETERTVTVYSQGVNQSSRGTDKVNAIINCHLLTGRIGRPGMGPLSFTGQPNAMGGREVGGLANMLAAHMGFDAASIDRVGRFWRTDKVARTPGLKAVEMFEAVRQGRIKALWVMATNPAVSLPQADLVRLGLEKCDFVAVSDCVATDTTRLADLLLPALTWGEKDGTVTNSERRISRQRAFLPPPGEARPDWWMLCELAKRLGHGDAFGYGSAADIFREHAALSGFENDGSRDFDIAALAEADYDRLAPTQWPVRDGAGTARLFGQGGFFHPDRRARFVATPFAAPASAASEEWPLMLNTGRNRDQWHTMSRTGAAPRLARHAPEPVLALHPADAAAHGIGDGDWAAAESALGEVALKVALDPGQRRGEAFAPIHWNDQFASAAVVGKLIGDARDPHSGQPELKITPIRLSPIPLFWEATLLSRKAPALFPADILWSRAAGSGHWSFRLAGREPVGNWRGWAQNLLGDGAWIDYQDRKLGLYRAALLVEHRLQALLLVGPAGARPDADFAAAWFSGPLDAPARAGLLSGGGRRRTSPIVCACHGVDRDAITRAIADGRLDSVEAVGRATRAGTGCGSCIPELNALLSPIPHSLQKRNSCR